MWAYALLTVLRAAHLPAAPPLKTISQGSSGSSLTVFKASREPLITLAHEFAHLVKNLKSGNFDKHIGPPDDTAERILDNQAINDLAEFRELDRLS